MVMMPARTGSLPDQHGQRGRRRRSGSAALLVVLVAALAACGTDDTTAVPTSSVPPNDIPPCAEIYREGVTVTNDDFGVACTTAEGRLITPVPIRVQCEDDRELLWNDLGWGFVGDPLTLTPEATPSKVPTDAVDECLADA